ncbi:MAG: PEP-CTERM sorting domain-containing protein [Planctomycetes bacterium]|nr:PEP-CTERM sorting domain-containing protein [Planctomycetota bacterium]
MRARLAVCTILTFLLLTPQSAVALVIHFTGVIDDKSPNTNGVLDTLNNGDTITGWFTYDVNAPDSNDMETVGWYDFNESNSALGIDLIDMPGAAPLLSTTGALDHINMSDNWTYPGYPTIDGYNVHGQFMWEASPIDIHLYFQYRDYLNNEPDLVTSDALLNAPPPLEQLNFINGVLMHSEVSWYNANFDITSIHTSPDAPVPEPGTLALLMLGGCGLAVFRKFKQR